MTSVSTDLSAPSPQPTEAQLIARLDQSRGALLDAAGVLQKPLQAVAQAEDVLRRVTQVLPYAAAAVAVIGIAGSLLGRRRVRPVLVIATGLDLWRLWKSYQLTAAMPSPASVAQRIAQRPLTSTPTAPADSPRSEATTGAIK